MDYLPLYVLSTNLVSDKWYMDSNHKFTTSPFVTFCVLLVIIIDIHNAKAKKSRSFLKRMEEKILLRRSIWKEWEIEEG